MKNTELSELAKQLGKRGGEKTKKKYGPDYYKKLSKKGLAARWHKKDTKN